MANRFWVGGTGVWDNTATSNWSTTSGGGAGASVPGSADTAVFDNGSGIVVVTASSSLNGITLGGITFTGTGGFAGTLDFSVNNPSITISGGFSITGTGTRVLSLGSGTFTFTTVNSGTNIWDATTTTGLTFSAGTSILSFTVTAATQVLIANFGTLTYSTINFPGNSTAGAGITLSGSPTIGTFNLTAPLVITFGALSTWTITTLSITGTSLSSMVDLFGSNNLASSVTISVATGTPNIMWALIRKTNFTGGATFIATNSIDNKGNSGITISNPSVGGSSGIIGA